MTSAPARTRRPTLPMWAVWAAVAVHGGLWLGLQAHRSEPQGSGLAQQRLATPERPTLHARLATQAPAEPSDAPVSDATLAEAATAAAQATTPDEAATTPGPQTDASDAASPQQQLASTEVGNDAYLSRDAVDQGPQPVSLIQIPYPEGVQTVASNGTTGQVHTGRLTLYIDENGAVRRVQVNSTELPTPFQEAARNAFLQARFVPGQRQGQAVKVRIDIEVSFDDRDTSPRPTPHPSA